MLCSLSLCLNGDVLCHTEGFHFHESPLINFLIVLRARAIDFLTRKSFLVPTNLRLFPTFPPIKFRPHVWGLWFIWSWGLCSVIKIDYLHYSTWCHSVWPSPFIENVLFFPVCFWLHYKKSSVYRCVYVWFSFQPASIGQHVYLYQYCTLKNNT